MGAITDLWKSERGLLAVLIIIAATVLTALGRMEITMWKEMSVWIFGLYAAGKTVTGAVDMLTASSRTKAEAAAAATPTAPIATTSTSVTAVTTSSAPAATATEPTA